MAERTNALATALATAAMIALPIIATAQTYPPSGSTSGQSTTGQSNPSSQYGAKDQNSPQFHLDEAKKVLESIDASSLSGDAASQISQIKSDFNNLYNAYKSKSGSSVSSSATSGGATSSSTASSGGQVGTSGSGATPSSGMTGASDWKTTFNNIESRLDALNVPKSAYAPQVSGTSTSGTSGTMSGGTSGTAGTSVTLPSDVRDKLEQFRLHLEQFYSLAQR